MCNPKISVIIPAYNVQEYISRGIKSVIGQTYTNLEIVIVNDGSTDKTWSRIQEYAKLDNRIIAINKNNGGVSSARNKALDIINGEYILFLDADDWLEQNTISYLVELASMRKNCLVACDRSFAYFDENNMIKKERQREPRECSSVNRQDALYNMGTGAYNLQSACYKLFDTQIIKQNNLRFDTELSHGEDGLFVFQYLMNVEEMIFSTEPLWNILERADSATTSAYNSKWISAIYAVEKMIDLSTGDNKLQSLLKVWLVERAVGVEIACICGKERFKKDIKEIRRKIKENGKVYVKNKRNIVDVIMYLAMVYVPVYFLKKIIIIKKELKK